MFTFYVFFFLHNIDFQQLLTVLCNRMLSKKDPSKVKVIFLSSCVILVLGYDISLYL